MADPKSRERFVDLAEKRVARAIKDLRLIGNLSNRTNYTYTDVDVRKIINALSTEIAAVKKRFETRNEPEKIVFKL